VLALGVPKTLEDEDGADVTDGIDADDEFDEQTPFTA